MDVIPWALLSCCVTLPALCATAGVMSGKPRLTPELATSMLAELDPAALDRVTVVHLLWRGGDAVDEAIDRIDLVEPARVRMLARELARLRDATPVPAAQDGPPPVTLLLAGERSGRIVAGVRYGGDGQVIDAQGRGYPVRDGVRAVLDPLLADWRGLIEVRDAVVAALARHDWTRLEQYASSDVAGRVRDVVAPALEAAGIRLAEDRAGDWRPTAGTRARRTIRRWRVDEEATPLRGFVARYKPGGRGASLSLHLNFSGGEAGWQVHDVRLCGPGRVRGPAC
jgi:hypothetical protein